MGYSEFEKKVLRIHDKKFAKIRDSWGVYDAYKWIRKNQWYNIGRPLKEHEFYTVIRKVNNLLAEEISNGNTVKFPQGMGCLEIRKRKAEAFMKNGKVEVTYPIDWRKTIRLWYDDPEEYKKKTLVRINTPHVFYIYYNKFKANYENKSFYEFSANRTVKRTLKKNIDKGEIDTLW